MDNLKEYFFNKNNYSDAVIKKFIYDFTDKFNPFLLISLNKQFVISYLSEMDEMNTYKVKDEFNVFENLIGTEAFIGMEELDKKTNILCRIYSYSDGVYKIEEVLEQYYNLRYIDHKNMSIKIQDFQYCLQEIILWLNSKSVGQYKQQTIFKKGNLSFNRNKWNKNAFGLFNYLDENYEKKGKIKFINIFKFLKSADKRIYAFNFTEDTYRDLILNLKDIELRNFTTAEYAYKDKELPILNSLEEVFRKESLK